MRKLHITWFMILVLGIVSCSNESWAYEFVRVDGMVYVVTDEVMDQEDVGDLIGEVETYSDREDQSVDQNTIFSNSYVIGTKLYKDVTAETAIVVEHEQGKFKKAIIEHEWLED
ncbi:hypothetical protein [Alkalicoccobacillus porphyridii]|uniref:Uncharacterized protein n=1 Tax=Alkalicoccobacillus porphyridii TaxID=2597270 RepID=A0A554A451_9BACI|nr:hypothetical protein [Alkalicoccobacillus porphyridii]TSB48468.1 hypothetical protein FN960_02635 [Alkalicoccobacillus porphyridii]